MHRLAFIAFLICFSNNPFHSACAQQAGNPEVERKITLKKQYGRHYGTVQLGEIPAGEIVHVKLVLTNPGQEPIDISDVRVGCSCISFQKDVSTIQPNDSATLVLSVEVPERSKNAENTWNIRLQPQGKKAQQTGVHLRVNYSIAGLLCFKDTTAVLVPDPKKSVSEFRIPLLLTQPVTPEDVEVQIPADFTGVTSAIEVKDSSHSLIVIVPFATLTGDGFHGEIQCRSKKLGRSTSLFCSIKKPNPLAVFPFQVRLKLSEERKAYTGTAILRSETQAGHQSSDSEKIRPWIVGATLNNDNLTVTSKQLSRSTARVTLSGPVETFASPTSLEGKSSHIQFRIQGDFGVYECSTPFVLRDQ